MELVEEPERKAMRSLRDAWRRKTAYVSGGVGQGPKQSRDTRRKKNAGRDSRPEMLVGGCSLGFSTAS